MHTYAHKHSQEQVQQQEQQEQLRGEAPVAAAAADPAAGAATASAPVAAAAVTVLDAEPAGKRVKEEAQEQIVVDDEYEDELVATDMSSKTRSLAAPQPDMQESLLFLAKAHMDFAPSPTPPSPAKQEASAAPSAGVKQEASATSSAGVK